MTTLLWVLQGLLALAFTGAGVLKLTTSPQGLVDKGMAWAEDFSAGQVKAIGAVEVLGAVGVIVPSLTGIAPALAGVAAAGLVLTMAAAAVVHVRRSEWPNLAPPVVLGSMAAFVAVQHLV